MINIIKDKQEALETSCGTSLKGYLYVTYNQLVEALGQPTIDEPSGDEKVQVEWVVDFKGETFTIYDWKTYSRDYTLFELDKFNVGGKSYAGDFIDYVEQLIKTK